MVTTQYRDKLLNMDTAYVKRHSRRVKERKIVGNE